MHTYLLVNPSATMTIFCSLGMAYTLYLVTKHENRPHYENNLILRYKSVASSSYGRSKIHTALVLLEMV